MQLKVLPLIFLYLPSKAIMFSNVCLYINLFNRIIGLEKRKRIREVKYKRSLMITDTLIKSFAHRINENNEVCSLLRQTSTTPSNNIILISSNIPQNKLCMFTPPPIAMLLVTFIKILIYISTYLEARTAR